MGSVSSLITSDEINSKHCKASELRLKNRTNQPRRNGGCSLDGLLKCGFSSSPVHLPKGLSYSRSGRSEDFFYIKVSHKPRPANHRGGSTVGCISSRNGEEKSDVRPKLMLMSGTDGTTAEKSLVRSTAYKPLIPRGGCSTEAQRNTLDHILSRLDKPKSPDIRHKQDTSSGNLSDSGRNSMSSLPTHSTSGSLSASTGPVSHSDGSSTPTNCLRKGVQPNLSLWVNSGRQEGGYRASLSPGGLSSKAHDDSGSPLSSDRPKRLSETVGGSRSPLTTDESLIETLEQRLLERENERQELQVSYEVKEAATCQLFEDRQKYCAAEMQELNQRCSTTLQQASQMAASSQQALQMQVGQLQSENERLKEDLAKLSQEREVVEQKLRAYEEESTQLAPALEETQWEVCQKAGEISLLKKQLRDSQEDVSHKLNEIVSLRAQLKEITAKAEMLDTKNKDGGDRLRSRTIEVEVCQKELQRKKNEAYLLREKVDKLEKDIEGKAKDQKLHQQLEPCGHTQATERVTTVHKTREEAEGQTSTKLLQKEVERLRQQLNEEKAAQEKLATSFDQERRTWNKEKDKVIKYQKQLQINYLQVHKKNQDLERLMKELTAELEVQAELGLDLKYSSGLQTYDDIIATEI
ncbi:leucine zipper putative tumor suppressor 1 isoform X1 [Phyllopteryx taeniolatus]|uniref:leucine zipper putative tumor suppressor 1 isoform X1 n=1 Tax=Phyllopteryx taeniolatus TaxID=161469 RepID=UPI002AD37430|nr:leucine zipper putative tumor suppressor 1 isoform X1 [Phyllopteryx taeniolatus]XP_061623268.1 leucine zipper putative tumor suppressor 1 isoform X1 [Phyllopteryx taeniolatus]XP_061623269.1 leucine zipper putative tumor suppressor 1 isoform X1 [Phyllopteryx taeniolatus]